MKSTGWSSRGWRRAGNKETDEVYMEDYLVGKREAQEGVKRLKRIMVHGMAFLALN